MTTHLQAKQAFLDDRENVGFYALTDQRYGKGEEPTAIALLASITGGERVLWKVADKERLRQVLARDDLTRIQGYPLVVANPAKKILGIAAGPAEPPKQIAILVVYDLAREVLGAEDGQPEWWLFDGELMEEDGLE